MIVQVRSAVAIVGPPARAADARTAPGLSLRAGAGRRKSTPTYWADWWCGSAIGCTTPASAPVWKRCGNQLIERSSHADSKRTRSLRFLSRKSSSYRRRRGTRAKSAASSKSATASRASTACPASWPAKWSSSRAPRCSGLAFNLEENSVGIIILGDYLEITEGDEVRSTGALLRVPVGDAVDWPRRRSAGQPDGRQRPDHYRPEPPVESYRARRRRSAAGQSAAANGHQGHRRHDAGRPRPARTHHRRPQDRQDGHRRRRDHQPAGRERHLRLRRHRPEGIDRGRRRRDAARQRRDGLHHRRRRLVRDRRPACNTSRPTPAPRWPSITCTNKAATRSASTTT